METCMNCGMPMASVERPRHASDDICLHVLGSMAQRIVRGYRKGLAFTDEEILEQLEFAIEQADKPEQNK